eukprot:1368634-Rhodomonas_salina.1
MFGKTAREANSFGFSAMAADPALAAAEPELDPMEIPMGPYRTTRQATHPLNSPRDWFATFRTLMMLIGCIATAFVVYEVSCCIASLAAVG